MQVEVPVQIIREVPVEVIKECPICKAQQQLQQQQQSMQPQQMMMQQMMPPAPWGCQYIEVPDHMLGTASQGATAVDMRPAPIEMRPAPTEIVREVPYEVVREVIKEIPIEVTRELADVPYWSSQRQEYERQIDERKQQRSMQGGSAMAHAMAAGMAPYGSQNRAPTPPMPPLGTGGGMGPPGMGGGRPGVAPGYKVWDPTRAAAPASQGGTGYRPPGRITGAGVLTSTGTRPR